MHPLFQIDDRLPVPAGESPFRVRGLYYDRLLARARKLPGGLASLLAELQDSSVRAFAEQRFAWNDWYDVLPTMPLYAALSRLNGRDFETEVRESTRSAAKEIVPRIFRRVVAIAGPAAVAARAAETVMHTVDFTRVTFERQDDGLSIATGSGIPRYVAPNIANLALGSFQGALELGGARDVSARYTDVFIDGTRAGLETVTVRYEFRWSR